MVAGDVVLQKYFQRTVSEINFDFTNGISIKLFFNLKYKIKAYCRPINIKKQSIEFWIIRRNYVWN